MEPLGPEVRRELSRFGPAAGMAELVGRWPAAVGPAIAGNAWPARFMRDGTLVVHTTDAVWAFELTQQAEEISSRLDRLVPGPLKFVPGPLPEGTVDEGIAQRTPVRGATLEEARRAAEWAAAIESPELRALVARAARASLAAADAGRSF
jgi:Dna[CI] antecedent, DciA